MPHSDLLVRVVQLDGELGGEYGLWRGLHAAVCADGVLGERGERPFRDQEHFCKDHVGDERVADAGAIAVSGGVSGRVEVSERVGWLGFMAALGEVEGGLVFGLVG